MAAIFILVEWLFWWLFRKHFSELARNCTGPVSKECPIPSNVFAGDRATIEVAPLFAAASASKPRVGHASCPHCAGRISTASDPDRPFASS